DYLAASYPGCLLQVDSPYQPTRINEFFEAVGYSTGPQGGPAYPTAAIMSYRHTKAYYRFEKALALSLWNVDLPTETPMSALFLPYNGMAVTTFPPERALAGGWPDQETLFLLFKSDRLD